MNTKTNSVLKELILIDDDSDDRDFFNEALNELNLQLNLTYFSDADQAFEYLANVETQPFLIVSDINMPGTNGFEFKKLLNSRQDKMLSSTPFIFITTSADPAYLRFAQMLNIQGYFIKPNSFKTLKELILKIVEYWESSAYTSHEKLSSFRTNIGA